MASSVVGLSATAHLEGAGVQDIFQEGVFSNARDIPGWGNLSDAEIHTKIDHFFLVQQGITSPYQTTTGTFIHYRHELNDRGDEAVANMMEATVWGVGVIQGIREGPWRIPHPDESQKTYGLLHWASLHEGVKRCIIRDASNENKAIQMTKQVGLKGIKEYHRRTPSWAIKFLVYTGNLANTVVSQRTFLQGLRPFV